MSRLRSPRFLTLIVIGGALMASAACGAVATPAPSPTATTSPPTATATPVVPSPTATSAPVVPSPAATLPPAPTRPPTPPAVIAPSPSPTLARSSIEVPAAGARVTLPLHILARVGEPGQAITATLRWTDGATRTATLTALAGEDGRGLVIGTPAWFPDTPPQPPTQPARLRLSTPDGRLLAEQHVTLLAPDDPDVMTVQLFWTVSSAEVIQPQTRHIPRSPRVATAALEELLWGPPQPTQAGYGTALPAPRDVLAYPGRTADWGPRVTLRSLTIENGVATADFSKEMRAYGGGSLRVQQIREQITRTLMQFPTVREVRVAIEGQTEGALEP